MNRKNIYIIYKIKDVSGLSLSTLFFNKEVSLSARPPVQKNNEKNNNMLLKVKLFELQTSVFMIKIIH